jgi:hypothetical protein
MREVEDGVKNYRGVHKTGNRYKARVTVEGKGKHIGVYPTEEEAGRAYDEAAKEIYGDFALLNFPENDGPYGMLDHKNLKESQGWAEKRFRAIRDNGDGTASIILDTERDIIAIIDAEDIPKVIRMSWYAKRRNCREEKYHAETVIGDNKHLRLHRHLMGEPPAGMEIDHKDRNSLNNRRDNLRFATRTQNNSNKINGGRYRNTGYRGVRKWGRRYSFEMRREGIFISKYGFASAEDAARAYDKKAREVFGEFAILNFPDEEEAC